MIVEAVINYIFDMRFIYQSVVFLITFSTLRILQFFVRRHKRYQLLKYYGIPGPKPDLYQGNLGIYIANPLIPSVDEELIQKYGKVFGVYIGDEPSVISSDLDFLHKVFFDDTQSFKERSMFFVDCPLARGLLFARHHRWKPMRKIMAPAFNKYSGRGASSAQFIEESVKLMLDHLDSKHHAMKTSGKTTFELDIHDLMKSTALHFISNLAIKLPDVKVAENEPHVKGLDEFLNTSDKGIFLWAIRFPILNSLFAFIINNFEYDVALALIQRNINKLVNDGLAKLKRGEHDSNADQLIDFMIKLFHEGKMSRVELDGNVLTILVAGYDTTSTTLTYVFWVLSKHQDIQEQLRQELMAHGTESKFLEQVIMETMRLYPTVVTFTTRLATKTVKINEWTIPKGTRIVHNTWLLHRNPDYWPEPEKFDPNRFRPGVDIHPCVYAPFGLNERRCLGYQLAMLEMKMVLCDILLRYKVGHVAPQELKLKSHAMALTAPAEKVILRMEKLF